MLPYGTLWKLDQMLHPARPPQRRTVAMRRRQALFLFLWGILLVTVFLFPYHYASLRRLRMEGSRRLRGVSAPQIDVEVLQRQQQSALSRLAQCMTMRDDEKDATVGDAARLTADFAAVFYHHPATEVRLRGMFDHPQLRALSGAGSGRLWRQVGFATTTATAGQRPMLAEAAAKFLHISGGEGGDAATGRATCLAALRRDSLVSRLGTAAAGRGGDGELTKLVSAAAHGFARLSPLNVSSARAASDNVSAASVPPPTETALAQLLLWIADGAGLSEEEEDAVAGAVAACTAPMSHSLQVSFDWRPVENGGPPRTKLFTTFKEVAEPEPLYVCLCSGPKPAHATALVDAAADATAAGLFLVDPRASGGATPSSCAAVCGS